MWIVLHTAYHFLSYPPPQTKWGVIVNVIKRSGVKEEFSIHKVTRSIEAANKSTGEEIDMPKLLTDFQHIVSEKPVITSQQIDVIVTGLLYTKRHLKTLTRYQTYEKGTAKRLK